MGYQRDMDGERDEYPECIIYKDEIVQKKINKNRCASKKATRQKFQVNRLILQNFSHISFATKKSNSD